MNKQRIKIDRLEIRLRGIAPETARSAVSSLGQNLLDQLSSPRSLSARKRAINIARLDPEALQVAAGVKPDELRNAIGERIANSIRSKLK